MAILTERVAWVGVVVVHDDGSTYAVEMDGTRQRIEWEIKTEYEYERSAERGWVELEGPPVERRVEVRVTGVGRPWAAGYSAAPTRTVLAKAAQARAIEAADHG